MKSFRALYLTAIVAITMERCRAEFLLIEVNDDKGGKHQLFCFIRYADSKLMQKLCLYNVYVNIRRF